MAESKPEANWAVRIVIFVIFFLIWNYTPVSTYAVTAIVMFIPRYLDVQMGKSGVAQAGYRESRVHQQRVARIGSDLVASLPKHHTDGYHFTFKAIEESFVNAFAYPGGPIFVTDKLISELDATDDELASVIAHEIGHVINRDSQRQIIHKSVIVLVFQALTYKDDDEHQESFGEAMGELLVKNAALFTAVAYSRAQEYQADASGWDTMTKAAGYDESAMISFFKKLKSLSPGDDGKTHWDSTHPGTADRIETLIQQCGGKCKANKSSKKDL
jgi:predicted Zn-dependent protease